MPIDRVMLYRPRRTSMQLSGLCAARSVTLSVEATELLREFFSVDRTMT